MRGTARRRRAGEAGRTRAVAPGHRGDARGVPGGHAPRGGRGPAILRARARAAPRGLPAAGAAASVTLRGRPPPPRAPLFPLPRRPVHILQLSKFYPPVQGGIETLAFELTEGLNARGVRT